MRRGTLLCFREIVVTKKFMDERRGGGEGAVSRFSVVIIKLKNLSEEWDSNPCVPLQKPVVIPTVPWEPLEFLTNVSEIRKKLGPTKTRTRTSR